MTRPFHHLPSDFTSTRLLTSGFDFLSAQASTVSGAKLPVVVNEESCSSANAMSSLTSSASSLRVICPSLLRSAKAFPERPATSISVNVQFPVESWLADEEVRQANDTL